MTPSDAGPLVDSPQDPNGRPSSGRFVKGVWVVDETNNPYGAQVRDGLTPPHDRGQQQHPFPGTHLNGK